MRFIKDLIDNSREVRPIIATTPAG